MAEELEGHSTPPSISPEDAASFSEPPPIVGVSQQQRTTPFQIGDQEFQLPEGLADALRAEMPAVQDLQAQLRQSTTQLEEMRGLMQRLQSVFQPEKESQHVDFSTQLLTDSEAARRGIVTDVLASLEAKTSREQQASALKQAFWKAFHAEHDDLKDDESLVLHVLQSDPALFNAPNTPESRKTLADRVRKTAIEWSQRYGGGTGRGTTLRAVEGGNRSRTASQEHGSPAADTPTSIGDLIRDRRAARRKAANT